MLNTDAVCFEDAAGTGGNGGLPDIRTRRSLRLEMIKAPASTMATTATVPHTIAAMRTGEDIDDPDEESSSFSAASGNGFDEAVSTDPKSAGSMVRSNAVTVPELRASSQAERVTRARVLEASIARKTTTIFFAVERPDGSSSGLALRNKTFSDCDTTSVVVAL